MGKLVGFGGLEEDTTAEGRVHECCIDVTRLKSTKAILVFKGFGHRMSVWVSNPPRQFMVF